MQIHERQSCCTCLTDGAVECSMSKTVAARVFDVENSIIICLDMMENMVLPKSPIGQSYYSRQLYLYLFGVVVHGGRNSEQSKDDIHMYVWGEHASRKDSNLFASALSHCLRFPLRGRINKSESLQLFSDLCYSQNKNMTVLSMLFALRQEFFPRMKVRYVFPCAATVFCQRIECLAELRRSCTESMKFFCHRTASKYRVTSSLYVCTAMIGLYSTTRLQRNQF